MGTQIGSIFCKCKTAVNINSIIIIFFIFFKSLNDLFTFSSLNEQQQALVGLKPQPAR